ncbi:MAG: hypothetical protein KC506_01130 [Nanoarchaeota archaeon]|nr:hypothetical protein [Nanoarchaeota archaeon]
MKFSKTSGIVAFVIIVAAISFYFSLSKTVSFSPEDSKYHFECTNNACTQVEGPGFNECSSPGALCGCIDTDTSADFPKGLNSKERGTARNTKESKTDFCSASGKILTEYSCEEGEVIFSQINCELVLGMVCQNGRCVSKSEAYAECTDSDKGSNYFTTGTVKQSGKVTQDYCRDEKTLGEIVCNSDENAILVELVDCSELGDYHCSGGACVRN